ncbi:MAG: hypothetical protein ACK53W_06050, partial [Gemmatimonadota bacterium]
NNGDARKSALSALISFFSDSWANPEFEVQTAAPTSSGFTVTLTSSSSNIWALIAPTGAFAAGTVVLPAVADVADGQEVLINLTTSVDTLTVSGNGATVATIPSGFVSGGGAVLLRFNALANTWYCVGIASPGGLRTSGAMTLAAGGALSVTSGAMTVTSTGTSSISNTGAMTVEASTNLLLKGADISIGVEVAGRGVVAIGCNPQTLAQLQALSTSLGNRIGLRGWCSNSSTTTFRAIIAAGANSVPCHFDGTNWLVG